MPKAQKTHTPQRSEVKELRAKAYGQSRAIAPMVERRIPNPMVGGSSPSCPAKFVRCENEKFNRIYQNVKGRAWQGHLSDERASA